MSYYLLHSIMARDLVGTNKKKCSWQQEYFFRSEDGRLASVIEFEDGVIYRRPACFRVKRNKAKSEEGQPAPPPFVERPGVQLPLPADAVPCAKATYDEALARCLKHERSDKEAAARYKRRAAAVVMADASAPAEALPAAVVAEPVPVGPVLHVGPAVDLLADYTVLDFEYFNPGNGAPGVPIELAAIRYVDGKPAGQLQRFIALPVGQFVPARISDITGITSAMLRGAPSVRQVLNEFRALAGSSTLVAHNITADRTILEQARTGLGATEPLPNPWLCTLAGARALCPKPHGLGELCKALGIEAHGAHRALRDVEMCQAVLRHLQGRPDFRLELLQQQAAKPKAKKSAPAPVGTPDLFAAA